MCGCAICLCVYCAVIIGYVYVSLEHQLEFNLVRFFMRKTVLHIALLKSVLHY
jgi:hypothetical protein